MATWKKVIVSGSTANLANIQVDGLTSGNVVIGGGSGSVLSTTAINGTGNIVATTAATGLVHSGSFSGSFQGNFVGTTNLPDLTQGTGITAFTYDGASTATVAVSGASALSTNNITKWTGNAFANSSLTDNGTTITGTTSLQLTGASSNLSGSFSGSYFGDGSGLSGVAASFPITPKTDLSNTDKFFINDGASKFVTYGNLLTDLAGTNLTVEGSDSLALAAQISVTGVTASFLGNLTGTASFATSASQAVTASYVLQAVSASYASSSTSASYSNNSTSASFATTASYVNGNIFTSTNPALSASYAASVNNLTNAITSNTDNNILTATGGGTINGESTLTFDGTTLNVNGNATITGNLSVAGTASFTNTDNLNIKDKFILINSGSTTLADSGWITQYNAAGSGSAFYLEAGTANDAGPYGRFAVAFDAIGTSTALTPSEYVVTAKINQASAPTTAVPPTWGTGSNGMGNMWIMNNAAGDIYIYS
jgi:hypothetical protein